jgi:UDP-glucuronate 4-epimerase
MTPYYDVTLKRRRHQNLIESNRFHANEAMLEDAGSMAEIWETARPDIVVHLAAQAGVRYSLEHPEAYVSTNLVGTFNVLELARRFPVQHLVVASTSSVYGANQSMPYREIDKADLPLTLYAATKKATELMAHSHSHLWRIPTTVMRFFTVYGPWGRPDMALFLFSAAILAGKPIQVFNHGRMRRDFTYIDDVVEGVLRVAARPPERNPHPDAAAAGAAPFRLYNIGNHQPVELNALIQLLEDCWGRPAVREDLPMQPGDVLATFADVEKLARDTGFRPATPIAEGVARFAAWYRKYYGV